jgi:glucose/arabinose dehydrogenase
VSIGDDGAACEAQDRSKLNGKILRIDVAGLPAEGKSPPPKMAIAPPTNPYYDGGENEALVYAYGFRNPFRFTIDPATNNLYVGDVGENTYEEVDEMRSIAPGANFGWPEFEGNLQDPVAGVDTCSTGPFTPPVFEYLHPPTIQSSVVCGPVLRPVEGVGFNFPPEYHGNLFVAEFYAGWIKRFVRGVAGWEVAVPVPGQKEWENWAIGLPWISDLQTGPDGALYFMNLLNGNPLERGLYRIIYTASTEVGGSPSPLATHAFPNPMRPGSGLTVRYAPGRPEAGVLRIFDLAGRLVRQVQTIAGTAHWDGLTATGGRPGAGIYVYELEAASGQRATGKLALVP